MADRGNAGDRLYAQAKRRQFERDQAREKLARLVHVLADLRDEAIAFRCVGQLRVEDFHRFIGVDKVVTADGGIDGRRFEVALSDLLRRRPELALRSQKSGGGSVE